MGVSEGVEYVGGYECGCGFRCSCQCDGPGGWVAWQGLALLCIEGKEYVGMGMWSMWVGVLVWVLVWVFVWVWVWVWVSSMWCGCWCGC